MEIVRPPLLLTQSNLGYFYFFYACLYLTLTFAFSLFFPNTHAHIYIYIYKILLLKVLMSTLSNTWLFDCNGLAVIKSCRFWFCHDNWAREELVGFGKGNVGWKGWHRAVPSPAAAPRRIVLLLALSRHEKGACSKAPFKAKLPESSASSAASLSILRVNSEGSRPWMPTENRLGARRSREVAPPLEPTPVSENHHWAARHTQTTAAHSAASARGFLPADFGGEARCWTKSHSPA